jgi:hypothetical protein
MYTPRSNRASVNFTPSSIENLQVEGKQKVGIERRNSMCREETNNVQHLVTCLS